MLKNILLILFILYTPQSNATLATYTIQCQEFQIFPGTLNGQVVGPILIKVESQYGVSGSPLSLKDQEGKTNAIIVSAKNDVLGSMTELKNQTLLFSTVVKIETSENEQTVYGVRLDLSRAMADRYNANKTNVYTICSESRFSFETEPNQNTRVQINFP